MTEYIDKEEAKKAIESLKRQTWTGMSNMAYHRACGMNEAVVKMLNTIDHK